MHNGVIYLTNTDEHRPGARRADRRDLIWENRVGPNALIGIAAHAQHGDLSGQGVRRDDRRAAGRARRAHRQDDLGHADRRSRERLRQHRRPDGRSRASSSTAWSAAIATATTAAGSAATTRRPASSCGSSTPSRGTEQPGAETWGKLADNLRVGGETWIAGSYDPDLDLTYWGIAQAKPWMRASRGHVATSTTSLYTSSTVALRPKDGTLAWHYQHAPGESLDLDEVFERVLVDIGDQKVVFTIGKPGILWKLDRRTGAVPRLQGDGLPERLRVDRSEDRRADVSRRHHRAARPASGCSRARAREGGHNWQAMSYHPPTGAARHPAQPVVHGDVRAQDRVHERLRRHRRRPPLLRDAGQRRQRRQARRLRREDDEGGLEPRAARAVPRRRCSRRPAASAFVGDLDRDVPARST